jgi:hypothetical protein
LYIFPLNLLHHRQGILISGVENRGMIL